LPSGGNVLVASYHRAESRVRSAWRVICDVLHDNMRSSHHLALVPVLTFAACGGGQPLGVSAGGGGGGEGGAVGAQYDAAPDDAAHPSFSCGNPMSLMGPATGFEACSTGYVRRLSPGTCPSSVPRAAAISPANPAIDRCTHDSDCSGGTLEFCGPREGGYANVCVKACATDADCGGGRICLCGEPAGRCVQATCTQASDCPAGVDCASGVVHPPCASTTFACQLPGDMCATDADCVGVFTNIAFCVLQDGHRTCSTEQCTTP